VTGRSAKRRDVGQLAGNGDAARFRVRGSVPVEGRPRTSDALGLETIDGCSDTPTRPESSARWRRAPCRARSRGRSAPPRDGARPGRGVHRSLRGVRRRARGRRSLVAARAEPCAGTRPCLPGAKRSACARRSESRVACAGNEGYAFPYGADRMPGRTRPTFLALSCANRAAAPGDAMRLVLPARRKRAPILKTVRVGRDPFARLLDPGAR
jgi:hypothetical protein